MKITGKTLKRAGAVLALSLAAVLMAYHASYPIRLNTLTLPEYVKDYYNRGRSAPLSPEIRLYGGGNFLDGIVENGGKKYLLFGGRDAACQIARIAVLIDGVSYELENEFAEKARDRFLLYTEIDSRVENSHIDRDRIVFYNDQGEDITEAYDLSGGGI